MNRNLILILLLTIISCTDAIKNETIVNDELKSKIGKELILPLFSDKCDSCKHKIITYIDGDCPSCLENLDSWKEFTRLVDDIKTVQFICYLHSSNYRYLKSNYDFFSESDFIIIYDKEKVFFKKNNLSMNKVFHTFLIDASNNILLVGNPMVNKKIEDIYLKLLNGSLIY